MITWLGPGFTVAVRVLVSAVVDAIVPVATPLALVVLAGCVIVLPVPVDVRITTWPATGLLLPSRTVTVIVEVAAPSARTLVVGEALALEFAELIPELLPTNTTVGVCDSTTWLAPGLTVTVMVLVSATVEAIVPVATPLALVVLAG